MLVLVVLQANTFSVISILNLKLQIQNRNNGESIVIFMVEATTGLSCMPLYIR